MNIEAIGKLRLKNQLVVDQKFTNTEEVAMHMVIGTGKRVIKLDAVRIEILPFHQKEGVAEGIRLAAERYATFPGKKLNELKAI